MFVPERAIQMSAYDRHLRNAKDVAQRLAGAPLETFLDDPTAFERAQALVDWHTQAAIIIATGEDFDSNS